VLLPFAATATTVITINPTLIILLIKVLYPPLFLLSVLVIALFLFLTIKRGHLIKNDSNYRMISPLCIEGLYVMGHVYN